MKHSHSSRPKLQGVGRCMVRGDWAGNGGNGGNGEGSGGRVALSSEGNGDGEWAGWRWEREGEHGNMEGNG